MSGPAEDGPDDGAGPAADAVTDVAGSIVIGGDHGGAAADGTREHGRSLSAVTAPGASSPDASSRNRMAAAVRRIISSAVAAQLEDATVVAATETLEGVADLLESVSGPDRLPRSQPYMESQPQDFFPTSPIIGYANPISPPVTISVVDGVDGGPREIRGTVNFGYPYEGPPTCVHGGVIAEVFDELGVTMVMHGHRHVSEQRQPAGSNCQIAMISGISMVTANAISTMANTCATGSRIDFTGTTLSLGRAFLPRPCGGGPSD